ncbi:SANT/Myb domain-containing protein [Dioscorea alata]|uniref:SANT/Myb domain-containing protein n=1 Tax=Dioscorea alata TaxID=55571 RepID=A0ACB7VB35_DIOAL|nr:SANT/Myb domain-containing protein [Dioscorea alata]
MAMGGYPCRPQGIITGGGDIQVNGVYGYASMGTVYNGVAIAGSSEGGQQGLQQLPQQVTVWTPDEHRIFTEGLQKYCTDPIVEKYAKIAAALPGKTIRDVALRLKWLMARKERRKRIRDGCHNSVINNNKKERIIYPSNSHALQMPHMPSDDNGDIRRSLFDLNKDIFKKVSENSQASENIELLYHALNNLIEVLRINVISDKENKMPPLPVNLNAQLVHFILQCSNIPHGEKLH